jgi:predicted transcriptional regulator
MYNAEMKDESMSASPARMTIELPQSVKERLEGLARATERSEAGLAVEAISSYVELQEFQIQQIQAGIREADAGDFASDDEVAALLTKWTNAR